MMQTIKQVLTSTPMLTMVAFAMNLIGVAIAGMDAKKILSRVFDEALPALA